MPEPAASTWQVLGLLAFELIVFPVLCGWMLDVVTLDVFGATVQSRVAMLVRLPVASTAIHWYVMDTPSTWSIRRP